MGIKRHSRRKLSFQLSGRGEDSQPSPSSPRLLYCALSCLFRTAGLEDASCCQVIILYAGRSSSPARWKVVDMALRKALLCTRCLGTLFEAGRAIRASGHRPKGALSLLTRPGGSGGPCSAFITLRARLPIHKAGEVAGNSQLGPQSLGAFWMGTVLRHVLLLQRDVQKAARFYNEGLSLPILALTDRWAEFGAGSSKIALKSVEG